MAPSWIQKHGENAAIVAEFLLRHPGTDKVFYPGFGGIVSFTLKNDSEEAATAFVTSTRYFKLAESLGGVKSLICHPAQMTHKSIPSDKRRAAGVQDSLIRLSVGLEDADDLVQDLKNSFTRVANLWKVGNPKTN